MGERKEENMEMCSSAAPTFFRLIFWVRWGGEERDGLIRSRDFHTQYENSPFFHYAKLANVYINESSQRIMFCSLYLYNMHH